MTKYLKLFIVALFATMSFALTSCGDDNDEPDAPTPSSVEFSFDGKNMFLRNSGELNYDSTIDFMQIDFVLYKSENVFNGDDVDVYAVAGADFEIKPFDVNNTTKGTKLEVVTSRHTWIEYLPNTPNFYGAKYYFKPTAGEITFEGYDKNNEIVTINVNITMSNKDGESVTLKGTVKCAYTDSPAAVIIYEWGDEYDY